MPRRSGPVGMFNESASLTRAPRTDHGTGSLADRRNQTLDADFLIHFDLIVIIVFGGTRVSRRSAPPPQSDRIIEIEDTPATIAPPPKSNEEEVQSTPITTDYAN